MDHRSRATDVNVRRDKIAVAGHSATTATVSSLSVARARALTKPASSRAAHSFFRRRRREEGEGNSAACARSSKLTPAIDLKPSSYGRAPASTLSQRKLYHRRPHRSRHSGPGDGPVGRLRHPNPIQCALFATSVAFSQHSASPQIRAPHSIEAKSEGGTSRQFHPHDARLKSPSVRKRRRTPPPRKRLSRSYGCGSGDAKWNPRAIAPKASSNGKWTILGNRPGGDSPQTRLYCRFFAAAVITTAKHRARQRASTDANIPSRSASTLFASAQAATRRREFAFRNGTNQTASEIGLQRALLTVLAPAASPPQKGSDMMPCSPHAAFNLLQILQSKLSCSGDCLQRRTVGTKPPRNCRFTLPFLFPMVLRTFLSFAPQNIRASP